MLLAITVVYIEAGRRGFISDLSCPSIQTGPRINWISHLAKTSRLVSVVCMAVTSCSPMVNDWPIDLSYRSITGVQHASLWAHYSRRWLLSSVGCVFNKHALFFFCYCNEFRMIESEARSASNMIRTTVQWNRLSECFIPEYKVAELLRRQKKKTKEDSCNCFLSV